MELTIGKLAKSAGVGVETIRFYERKGLLRQPQRREQGFRTYAPETIARIRFIRRAQELGFTLREVKQLIDLQTGKRMTGEQVHTKALQKTAEIESKIVDLQRMADSLRRLAKQCGSGDQATQECRLLECFEKSC